MGATLTIQLPDEIYDVLVERSRATGKPPEDLAADYLAGALATNPQDRLLRWTGAFASDTPDAAQRHDHYLGQALQDDLSGDSGD